MHLSGGYLYRMSLVKTLLGKTMWDKNLVKEKEYNIQNLSLNIASLKTLQRKTQWEKNLVKEKRVQCNLVDDNLWSNLTSIKVVVERALVSAEDLKLY